jgi:hypothetical protein
VKRLQRMSRYPYRLLVITAAVSQLGEELVASYLYQVHLYHWLETNDYGRLLIDNDRGI